MSYRPASPPVTTLLPAPHDVIAQQEASVENHWYPFALQTRFGASAPLRVDVQVRFSRVARVPDSANELPDINVLALGRPHAARLHVRQQHLHVRAVTPQQDLVTSRSYAIALADQGVVTERRFGVLHTAAARRMDRNAVHRVLAQVDRPQVRRPVAPPRELRDIQGVSLRAVDYVVVDGRRRSALSNVEAAIVQRKFQGDGSVASGPPAERVSKSKRDEDDKSELDASQNPGARSSRPIGGQPAAPVPAECDNAESRHEEDRPHPDREDVPPPHEPEKHQRTDDCPSGRRGIRSADRCETHHEQDEDDGPENVSEQKIT
jgi:hypothetical protein